MITVNELHMQLTVKEAVLYIKEHRPLSLLRTFFNKLCEDWHADEFNPDELSLDINDITRHLALEPWVKDLAALPEHELSWQMTGRVVDDFICKYWMMSKEEVTAQMVKDVLRVADPLSRRHILAQRVVINCIHDLQTEAQLRRLDCLMDDLAMNPKLER